MLESYWVVDSIASRLRVTVSPRIISRNLDVVGDIKTLHLNLDLSPPRNKGTSMFPFYGFSFFQKFKFKLNESVQFSIRPIFQLQHFYSNKVLFENRVRFSKSCFHLIIQDCSLGTLHLVICNNLAEAANGFQTISQNVKCSDYISSIFLFSFLK